MMSRFAERASSAEDTIDPEAIAAVAKALGHPARIRIVRLLLERQSCIGGDIVGDIGLAQSTVSEHLRILKAAGIIQGEIERPRVCYALRAEALVPLAGLLEAIRDRTDACSVVDPGRCAAPQPTTAT